MDSPGKKFRRALEEETPLQIVGTLNAYAALMAKQVGYKAIYLSGAGVANYAFGLPDLGMTTLDNVLSEARRITSAVDLPLLVDIDTGWGDQFMIERTIQQMARAGVAAVHIEDQVSQKRCGHRPGKVLVHKEEMCDRIRAAVRGKPDEDFVVMARTDAVSVEGVEGAVARARAYEEAGADMLFCEALENLEDYAQFKESLHIPILANLTEFGKTPLYSLSEMASARVDMVLYPLSATRAMQLAALKVYSAIREEGTQKGVVDLMQTRDELYGFLQYHNYEQQLDEHLAGRNG